MDSILSDTNKGPKYNYHLITFEYGKNSVKLPAVYDIILSITELIETKCNLVIYTDVSSIPITADNMFKNGQEKLAVSRCRTIFTNACKKKYSSGESTLQIVRGSYETFKSKYIEVSKNGLLNVVQFSGHHMKQFGYLWPLYLQTGGDIEQVSSKKLAQTVSISSELIFINDCCHGPRYDTKHVLTKYANRMSYVNFLETSEGDSIPVDHRLCAVYINLIEGANLKSNHFSNVLYKIKDIALNIFSKSKPISEKDLLTLYKHLASSHNNLKLVPTFYLSASLYLQMNGRKFKRGGSLDSLPGLNGHMKSRSRGSSKLSRRRSSATIHIDNNSNHKLIRRKSSATIQTNGHR